MNSFGNSGYSHLINNGLDPNNRQEQISSTTLPQQEISLSSTGFSTPFQHQQQELLLGGGHSSSLPDHHSLVSTVNTLEHHVEYHGTPDDNTQIFTPHQLQHQDYIAADELLQAQHLWIPMFSSEPHDVFVEATSGPGFNFPSHRSYPESGFHIQNTGRHQALVVNDTSYDQVRHHVAFNGTRANGPTLAGGIFEPRAVDTQQPLMDIPPTSSTDTINAPETSAAVSSRSSTPSYSISRRGISSIVHCNPHVVNEYMWLPLPALTTELKERILALAREKKLKSPNNDQIPNLSKVAGILDSFAQTHLELKLIIMNALYGDSLGREIATQDYRKLPKMTLREGGARNIVEILVQTSNGVDERRPEFINASLVGLRHCPVLRNQLFRTSTAEVKSSTDKRPHNSWFLYRVAQMNRASILKMTECLPNDLETLQRMKDALLFNVGVGDKEEYIIELRQLYKDPHQLRIDVTALGYVVAYMWAFESDLVKSQLAEFSRLEHAHKLKVFPDYRYAPARRAKRRESSSN